MRKIIFAFFIFGIAFGSCQSSQQNSPTQEASLKNSTEFQADTLKPLTNEADLLAGKELYLQNCAACHQDDGTGSIGPNLTDEQSLHGNTYADIWRVTFYGVPEKGMVAWNRIFSTQEMQQVVSYTYFLQKNLPPK